MFDFYDKVFHSNILISFYFLIMTVLNNFYTLILRENFKLRRINFNGIDGSSSLQVLLFAISAVLFSLCITPKSLSITCILIYFSQVFDTIFN